MSLYFVVALSGSSSVVETAVNKTFPATDVFKIEDGKWMIDAPLTISKEVSEKLGISTGANHVVVPVRSGYYGRAQPSLWEWLSAKASKTTT